MARATKFGMTFLSRVGIYNITTEKIFPNTHLVLHEGASAIDETHNRYKLNLLLCGRFPFRGQG
jgi:hypothetical protein